jgi:hypothetical protein
MSRKYKIVSVTHKIITKPDDMTEESSGITDEDVDGPVPLSSGRK